MAQFLADKSALTRRDDRPELRAIIEPLLLAGRIATCGIIDLELLYSASNPNTYQQLAAALRGMPRVPITEACSSGPSRSKPRSPATPSTAGPHSPT